MELEKLSSPTENPRQWIKLKSMSYSTANSSHIFQTVRQAARIEEIIGEHISLRPAGRELVGLCPFHEDRRPSMYVNPNKQIFYCFVCNAGGDVFKFVQNYHKMSPGEALRFLAQRYGVKLPEFRPNDPVARQKASAREKMLAATAWAAEWFRANLEKPAGKHGLDYILDRGLNEETIKAFGLGVAAENWTALAQAAGRAGVPKTWLVRRSNSRNGSVRINICDPLLSVVQGFLQQAF